MLIYAKQQSYVSNHMGQDETQIHGKIHISNISFEKKDD